LATLLVAPAAHGKTQYAVQRIASLLANEPLAPVIVILPNQARLVEFRRRLATSGGGLGVGLFTFHALYADLLARASQTKARLLDPIQIRLLRHVVDQLWQRGRLQYYAPLRIMPGFVAALRDAIQELKRDRIEPQEFTRAVAGLGPHLQELAAIYTAYQEWLLQEDWADPEGQGWLAAIALEQIPQIGRETRLLVATGFDEFNPTQLRLLSLLAERAGETLITLTGDLDRPRQAHRRFLRAQQALIDALHPQLQALAQDPSAPTVPDLAYLEDWLFERAQPSNPGPPASISAIQFVEAQNRSEEVRAALRWVKACRVRDGFALSDVAILARNLDAYRPFLEETASEFGIPLRVVEGLPLIQNPTAAALLNLLSIPALDWPRRQVLEAWRSPYFDWSVLGIGAGDAAALDNLSRTGRVISGLSQWREAFELFSQQKQGDDLLDDEEMPSPPTLEIAAIGDKFEAFVARLTPPDQASMRTYVAYVEDLIGEEADSHLESPAADSGSLAVVMQAAKNPTTAHRDLAALRAFKDVLRGLVLAEAVLQGEPLDFKKFFEELRGALEALTYKDAPGSGVLASSVSYARGLSFGAVALLGLSQGEFPQAEREDPMLPESDRDALRQQGIPLTSRLLGEEVTFFYQAVTRARRRLLLTRPYLAEDGQEWEPSPYWLHVRSLLGNPQARRVRPEDPLPPSEAASPFEFIQASGQLEGPLARGAEILRSRLARRAVGPYEGETPQLSALLAARYPARHRWSASRLEAYGTCPFYFFIAHALHLEPRPPPEEGYDARILGSMLHRILEDAYRQASDPTDLEECLQRLPEVARKVFASAPAEYGFRPSPLWELQQQELERILSDTMRALAEVSQGFTPCFFEEKFGMGQPPLVLETGIGEIRLHGFIDRLDLGPDGRLRVVDYKAGGAAITAEHLSQGRRLQLPLYALAASQALGLGEIWGGFYWHIRSAKASSLKLETFEGGVEGAIEAARMHVTAHVGNIHAGQFQPEPPTDGCPAYCPAAGFCWRYKPKSF
jgi:ATP-dependent helicase/DNAse subunit B